MAAGCAGRLLAQTRHTGLPGLLSATAFDTRYVSATFRAVSDNEISLWACALCLWSRAVPWLLAAGDVGKGTGSTGSSNRTRGASPTPTTTHRPLAQTTAMRCPLCTCSRHALPTLGADISPRTQLPYTARGACCCHPCQDSTLLRKVWRLDRVYTHTHTHTHAHPSDIHLQGSVLSSKREICPAAWYGPTKTLVGWLVALQVRATDLR